MRNVMVKKRSPEVPSTTPLTKNSLFLTGHRLAVRRKNKQRKASWADLFCRFFELALPLSPDQWARTHRHSERTCAREWLSDGRTSSSFFFVKVNVWPTESYHTQKNFFRNFSSETCPWIHHNESLSCSSAPIKATDQAIETGGTVIHFEERCLTAKNNFD